MIMSSYEDNHDNILQLVTTTNTKSNIIERHTFMKSTESSLPIRYSSAPLIKSYAQYVEDSLRFVQMEHCDSTTDDIESHSDFYCDTPSHFRHISDHNYYTTCPLLENADDSDSDCQIVDISENYLEDNSRNSGNIFDDIQVISDSDDETEANKNDNAVSTSHNDNVYEIFDGIKIVLPSGSKDNEKKEVSSAVQEKKIDDEVSSPRVKRSGNKVITYLNKNSSNNNNNNNNNVNRVEKEKCVSPDTSDLQDEIRVSCEEELNDKSDEEINDKSEEESSSTFVIDSLLNDYEIQKTEEVEETSCSNNEDDMIYSYVRQLEKTPVKNNTKDANGTVQLSPESIKSEFYSYLKINTNPLAQKAEAVHKNRRSIRVQNLIIQNEKLKEKLKQKTQETNKNDVRKKYMKYMYKPVAFPPIPDKYQEEVDFKESIEHYFRIEKVNYHKESEPDISEQPKLKSLGKSNRRKQNFRDNVHENVPKKPKIIYKKIVIKRIRIDSTAVRKKDKENFFNKNRVFKKSKKLLRSASKLLRNSSKRSFRHSLETDKLFTKKKVQRRETKTNIKSNNTSNDQKKSSNTKSSLKSDIESKTDINNPPCTVILNKVISGSPTCSMINSNEVHKIPERDPSLSESRDKLIYTKVYLRQMMPKNNQETSDSESSSLRRRRSVSSLSSTTMKNFEAIERDISDDESSYMSYSDISSNIDMNNLKNIIGVDCSKTETDSNKRKHNSLSESDSLYLNSELKRVEENGSVETVDKTEKSLGNPVKNCYGFVLDSKINKVAENLKNMIITITRDPDLKCSSDEHLSTTNPQKETLPKTNCDQVSDLEPEICNSDQIKSANKNYIPLNPNKKSKSFHKYLTHRRKSNLDSPSKSERLFNNSSFALSEHSDSETSQSTAKSILKKSQTHKINIYKTGGPVFNAYYVNFTLIIVQEFTISFWKQTPLGNILGSQNMWYSIGSIKRIMLERGCINKRSSEMVLSTESSVAYIELWTKEHQSEYRERPITDVFATVYFHKAHGSPDKKVLQLENIKGYGHDVRFAVMRNSLEIVVSWFDTFSKPTQTIVRSYQLAADFQTVSSIKEMETVPEYILSIHNIENSDNLVLGASHDQVFLWNLTHGWLATNINFEDTERKDLPSQIHSICLWTQSDTGFLFLLQQVNRGMLRLVAVNGLTSKWKQLQSYNVPECYENLLGVTCESGILILCYTNGVLVYDIQNGEIMMETETPSTHITLPSDKYLISINDYEVIVKHVMVNLLEDN